jgi:hypothetical protein
VASIGQRGDRCQNDEGAYLRTPLGGHERYF